MMRPPVRAGLTCATLVLAAGVALSAQPPTASDGPELDYLFFKQRVQPILVEKRAEQARCLTCHTHESPLLEPLSPGASTWTNQQSRRNFEIWKELVVPGQPMESALLAHPLATEEGGSAFHAGGKRWASTADGEWQTLAAWVRGQRLGGLAMPLTSGVDRVLQTSSAGDSVLVIDPAVRAVVGVIEGIEASTGVAIAPDGRRVYVTNRALRTLDVVDVRTLQVFKRIDLSGVPSDVDAGHDGERVYVGIRGAPGAPGGVDVIDARALIHLKRIPVDGSVESVQLTPDGTHLFVGTPETPALQGIDVVSHDSVTWRVSLDAGVEAMDFAKSGDGSTRNIVVQLRGRHGFTVISFGTRQVVERIEPPGLPPGDASSYGLAFDPDQDTLWVVSSHDDSVVAYDVPSPCRPGRPRLPGQRCAWEQLESVRVGRRPAWLTMTPDGTSLYVSLAGENATAVVDTATMAAVAKVSTGRGPGRSVAGSLVTR